MKMPKSYSALERAFKTVRKKNPVTKPDRKTATLHAHLPSCPACLLPIHGTPHLDELTLTFFHDQSCAEAWNALPGFEDFFYSLRSSQEDL
jgi:hypothetical protein